MKIVLLSDWFLPRLGGVEIQIRDLAGELASRGHRVDVVTTTPADPRAQGTLQTGAVDVPEGVTVHRVDVPLVPWLNVTLSVRARLAMREHLAAIAPDVVHVHASVGSTGALAGGWAIQALGLPGIVTFHSALGWYRHVLRACDLATGWARWPWQLSAVSRAVARDISWLAPGRSVTVLPNGIDPARWSVEPQTNGRDALRLVSVMRLQYRKRPLPLIEVVGAAAARLRGIRRLELTVVGDGPQRAKMEARAHRLGIGDAVAFVGYQPRHEIRRRFAQADAFIHTCAVESFGIAALEARAAGLPVVARGDTGMGELLEHGREGLLGNSDEAVVDHLVRLGSEPGLLERIAAHNRAVPPSVSWDSTVERHLAAYERAIDG